MNESSIYMLIGVVVAGVLQIFGHYFFDVFTAFIACCVLTEVCDDE